MKPIVTEKSTILSENNQIVFLVNMNSNKLPEPNIIIVDPPRSGMHEKMTKFLPKLNPDKIIYVSCNPSTQARDSKILQSKINNLLGMFPHTPHIETVGVFQKS